MTHLSYTHLLCRVSEFWVVAPYTLRIVFDDATEKTYRGELYGPLRDPRLFNQVVLDTQAGTTFHDWTQCQAAFVEMASRWEPPPA